MTDEPCPCNCDCHTKESRPMMLEAMMLPEVGHCASVVTDEQRAMETLGAGGQYVCGWCYTVCEGVE